TRTEAAFEVRLTVNGPRAGFGYKSLRLSSGVTDVMGPSSGVSTSMRDSYGSKENDPAVIRLSGRLRTTGADHSRVSGKNAFISKNEAPDTGTSTRLSATGLSVLLSR